MAESKLTAKQQRLVDCYDGDIKKAAEISGISYAYARQLLTLPKHKHVQAAIKSRERTKSNKLIATREERQEFWTMVKTFDVRNFYDEEGNLKTIKDLDDDSARLIQSIKITKDGDEIEYKLPDRLKASELLGRSEGDFIDRHKHDVEGELTINIIKYGNKPTK